MDDAEIEQDLKYPFRLDKEISKIRKSIGPYKYKNNKSYGKLWYRSKAYTPFGIYTGEAKLQWDLDSYVVYNL